MSVFLAWPIFLMSSSPVPGVMLPGYGVLRPPSWWREDTVEMERIIITAVRTSLRHGGGGLMKHRPGSYDTFLSNVNDTCDDSKWEQDYHAVH